jgi:small-conductance mechanosensitive channel
VAPFVRILNILLLLPDWLTDLSGQSSSLLMYQFFKIGALAITPLFALKAALFITILVLASNFLQKVVLGRLFRHVSISDSLKFALSRFAMYLFFLGGLFIGLQSLGVNLNSLVVFGGAVGVGVGLGLQNVVSNFVAGLILLIEQPIRIGDRIETQNTLGDVVKIAARSTWIRTNQNVIIIVPNNDFINQSVTNWTANDATVRIDVPVGVGYGSKPQQVKEIMLRIAAAHPDILSSPASDVILTGYGDNSVDFELRVWTGTCSHTPSVLKSDLYFTLFEEFAKAGIELPFPQRDLHIRSSDIPFPYTKAGTGGDSIDPVNGVSGR